VRFVIAALVTLALASTSAKAASPNRGTFEAHGIHTLQVRVREIVALGQLAQMSRSKEFAEAAGKAIARPVTSTANMIVHPVETISGIPDGVGRMYDRVKLGTQTVYESATAKGTSDSEKVADVSKRVDGITVSALGYEKERRDLAKGLSIDPYTTNTAVYDTPPAISSIKPRPLPRPPGPVNRRSRP